MAGETPFHNPFAALGALAASRPAPLEEAPVSIQSPASVSDRRHAKAVVRYERTGRGGKQVTVIEQLDLDDAARAEWLRAFKAALGCGGVVEGATIVLQGDQRKRLPTLLTARNVRRVIVS